MAFECANDELLDDGTVVIGGRYVVAVVVTGQVRVTTGALLTYLKDHRDVVHATPQ